jgi:hypothetical protein
MIEVKTPDGGIARFPDGTPKEVIKNALKKKFAPPQIVNTAEKGDRQRSLGEKAGDVGMSAAQGFQSGFQGLLGSVGDAQQITGDIAAWGAGKLGFSPETQDTARNIGKRIPTMGLAIPAPTTPQVNTAFESVIGPKYKPQTDMGRYARTTAEFAPAAIAGPGSVVRKTAMSVLPGLAVEATGDLTDGNPYAKAAAGITAGVLTAGRGNAGTKEMLKTVGKSDRAYSKLEREVNNAYGQLRAAGIKYDANAVDAAINDVSQLRINPNLAPKAVGLQQEFAKFAGKGMDFQDLDDMERIATSIMRSATDATDKMFTAQILGKIKDVRERGAFITNGSVPAGEVNDLVKRAKDLARRRIVARDVNKMKDKSEWYLSGPESGLRNQMKSYGQKNMQNLSDAEEAAFKSVVAREGLLNPLHNAGSRLGQIAMGGVGFGLGGIAGAIIPIIGSSLARRFMEAYTKKGVDNALKTVLAGRSAQEQAAVRDAISKWEARARMALTADTSVRSNLPFSPGSGSGATVPR